MKAYGSLFPQSYNEYSTHIFFVSDPTSHCSYNSSSSLPLLLDSEKSSSSSPLLVLLDSEKEARLTWQLFFDKLLIFSIKRLLLDGRRNAFGPWNTYLRRAL